MEQYIGSLVAQTAATPPVAGPGALLPGCQQSNSISFFVPLLAMFAILYFLIIRPQQKQVKVQRQMLESLKKGDKVVTNGGIFGVITNLSESAVTLEIAKSVHIRILRSQIAGPQPQGDKGAEGSATVPGENHT